MKITRRDFVKHSTLLSAMTLDAQSSTPTENSNTIKPTIPLASKQPLQDSVRHLHWLDGSAPVAQSGSTWGAPWAQGVIQQAQQLRLINTQGDALALQSWPLAYWPDGSLKWTGHSLAANTPLSDTLRLEKSDKANNKPSPRIRTTSSSQSISVDTGLIRCVIPTQGRYLFLTLQRGKKTLARHACLVGSRSQQAETESDQTQTLESFFSHTQHVEIEQAGDIRTVIKISGTHQLQSGEDWLPFTLRLYFYAGGESLRINHTFIFDGEPEKDFIRSLGLRVDVPMSDELHNRHIRFVGEGSGLWAEAVRGITGLRRDPGQNVRDAQIDGKPTPPVSRWDKRVSSRLEMIPSWGDYKCSQLSANGFVIKKRTKKGHPWIDSDQGHRASGVAYVGGASGGVLVGMRDFWQLHPTEIEITQANTSTAQVNIWLWSPDAPTMDLRFYHDGLGLDTHEKQLEALNITYEDYEPGFGNAQGIARSSDISLFALDSTPSRQRTIELAETIRNPAQLVVHPKEYLHSHVFGGLWSLPDHSSTQGAALEEQLAWSIEYYQQQIQQRHWYGFWNYGDVMHTYDADRHVWRYDIGGYAWDNSELSPDLWLWFSFLRTGDKNTFRLAEAMSRHNRDVDIYHSGRFAGLGTRHNVQHWGCSAKQLRISTSAYRRFHYYLCADERTGDVLSEVLHADQQLAKLNPTRKLPNQSPVPTSARIGIGTDFGSAAANWLTQWERSGDPVYRRYLENAMKVIGEQPLGFFVGSYGYDPDSKTLIAPNDPQARVSHLSAVFGLFEICHELIQLIDVPSFKQAWLQYCELYNASPAEQRAALGRPLDGISLAFAHSRLSAYAAKYQANDKLAERAWREFNTLPQAPKIKTQTISGPHTLNPIDEAPWLSTNVAAQWALAAIQNMALIPFKNNKP
ncbi:MAG: Tat pathway signal sequence domain protein [Spongiibacteraceae bacterium]|nr:Tat pathway signal sequence domain protein [Spongiibacteraceae bacterium]